MSLSLAIGSWGLAGLFAGLTLLVYLTMRRRVSRARAGERQANERRERFLAVAAGELDGPLATLRSAIAALDPWTATPQRVTSLAQEVDRMREALAELGRVPAPLPDVARVEVDLAELVRDVVGQAPFADRGPSVMLRASPALVWADRGRLSTGLRLLLWAVRRGVADGDSLVVTVSSDDDGSWLELDSGGAGEVVEALERVPAVVYGVATAVGPPGTTLALQVASEVARIHGGRLSATARVGQGERFVLELPRRPVVTH
jgi:signal transduction histidine kinase